LSFFILPVTFLDGSVLAFLETKNDITAAIPTVLKYQQWFIVFIYAINAQTKARTI